MSGGKVSQFLERLCSDSAFRAHFRTVAATKINEILDFALSEGFVFTEKDLKTALANFSDNPIIDQLRENLKIAKAAHPAQPIKG